MQRRLVLVMMAVAGLVFVARPTAQPPARSFEGWMGIDPVDGGDPRRSLRLQPDGTYALVGRDTVLTLCNDTDRGIAIFEDGTTTGRDRMGTDNLTIRRFDASA